MLSAEYRDAKSFEYNKLEIPLLLMRRGFGVVLCGIPQGV